MKYKLIVCCLDRTLCRFSSCFLAQVFSIEDSHLMEITQGLDTGRKSAILGHSVFKCHQLYQLTCKKAIILNPVYGKLCRLQWKRNCAMKECQQPLIVFVLLQQNCSICCIFIFSFCCLLFCLSLYPCVHVMLENTPNSFEINYRFRLG